MPYYKFDPTVRELLPILDDRRQTITRGMIDHFARFAACRIEGQPERLKFLRSRKLDR